MPTLDPGHWPLPALDLSAWQGVKDVADPSLNSFHFGCDHFRPCLVLSALFTLSTSVAKNTALLKGQWPQSDMDPHSSPGGPGTGRCASGQPEVLPGKRRLRSLPKVTASYRSGLFLPLPPWTQPGKAAEWNGEVLFAAGICLEKREGDTCSNIFLVVPPTRILSYLIALPNCSTILKVS